MKSGGLSQFFEKYLEESKVFANKKALQASYTPESILHRDEQVSQIANILAPALRLDKPSNLFLYGKTGTGKTVCVKHISKYILNLAAKNDLPIKIIYLNCKLRRLADTEYRLIAQVLRKLGKSVPATGLPTDEVYGLFYSALEKNKGVMILILDEIDQLVKKTGDEIIYNLTRINSELKYAQISIIGISNSLVFTDELDPRVKSSLSEEEFVFPPYNAIQIQDILHSRTKIAFKAGIIESGVIEKCAAYAARDHGDARRALELLRVAGELTERKNKTRITIKDLDEAEEKIERDRFVEIVKTQPKQSQATLYTIMMLNTKNKIYTGDIYQYYKDMCGKINIRPLTQRRVSGIIAELDMLGIINANVVSKGRHGRTKEVMLSLPKSVRDNLFKILKKELFL